MFNNNFSEVFVVCPANSRTGGLELLHQLVYALNFHGCKATIAYTDITNSYPTNEAYKKYVNEYVSYENIKDDEDKLVIISEHQIELVSKFKNAITVIWWLSVDNYQKVYNPIVAFKLLGVKGVLWYIRHRRWRYRVSRIRNLVKYNLAQSYYAIDYLTKNGFLNIEYLSDYINSDYLNNNFEELKNRENVVLYNPKKGKRFSDYLMSLDRNVKWIPLINLNNQQVKELLLKSKVYVDFGNHPGKDRFPREAAACGCCVITDKRGSANFYNDVPILDKYKFEDNESFGDEILNCIRCCFDNYNECFEDFREYRKMILEEENKFFLDVKKIFLE